MNPGKDQDIFDLEHHVRCAIFLPIGDTDILHAVAWCFVGYLANEQVY